MWLQCIKNVIMFMKPTTSMKPQFKNLDYLTLFRFSHVNQCPLPLWADSKLEPYIFLHHIIIVQEKAASIYPCKYNTELIFLHIRHLFPMAGIKLPILSTFWSERWVYTFFFFIFCMNFSEEQSICLFQLTARYFRGKKSEDGNYQI